MFRIFSEDAIKRGVVTVSSAAGALGAANLLTDVKAQPCRPVGTSLTITITWPSPEIIGAIIAPWCYLSALATMHVQGYTLPDDAVPVLDPGAKIACPGGGSNTRWGIGANSFAFGGYATARAWVTPTSVRKLVITIDDPTNPAGYIEVSRLIAGPYFQPDMGPDWSAAATPFDSGVITRNSGGDAVPTVGYKIKKHSLNLSTMTPRDRELMAEILWNNGKTVPHFISRYPDHADGKLERDYQMYCVMTNDAAISMTSYQRYSLPLEFESV